MDVFGGAWNGYVDKLSAGFQAVGEEDTVVLCGDISWGMSLEQAEPDFAFLDALPGRRKLLLKGNHDYWWTTAAKMKRFFDERGFRTLEILHNNCHFYGETALCGTRGWFYEEDQQGHNEKVFRRELLRLEASLKAAGEHPKLCFLHYPALLPGLHLPGDPGPLGALRRGTVLLRTPSRREPPPGGGGPAGRRGILPGVRRLPSVHPQAGAALIFFLFAKKEWNSFALSDKINEILAMPHHTHSGGSK